MGGLLTPATHSPDDRRAACKALAVDGVRYANSAAKFWPNLVDEVRADFPSRSHVELAATDGGRLVPDLLFPERELQRDIERLWDADLQAIMQGTLAQLELLGPPGCVQIRLLAKGVPLLSQALPADCVDTETYPYLLVWLLQWARVAEGAWNAEAVAGRFTGVDRRRHREYRFEFALRNEHLSEGLFRRTLLLSAAVQTP